MKQILFGIAIILVCGLSAGLSSAQEQGSKGAVVKPGAAYNPKIDYAGDYRPMIVFFRNSSNDNWHRRPRLDRLRRITCQDALDALNKTGLWRGDLNLDGSCHGTPGIESPEWALGNRLNYDEGLQNSSH